MDKVYIVARWIAYGGYRGSFRVFLNREAAEKYVEMRTAEDEDLDGGREALDIIEREVHDGWIVCSTY